MRPKTQPEVARPKGSLQHADTGETAATAERREQVVRTRSRCYTGRSVVAGVLLQSLQSLQCRPTASKNFLASHGAWRERPAPCSDPCPKRLRPAPASSPSSLPLHRTLARLDNPSSLIRVAFWLYRASYVARCHLHFIPPGLPLLSAALYTHYSI